MEASWKRYFTPVTTGSKQPSRSHNPLHNTALSGNFSSYLPEVYAGAPNRLERYNQYDSMDQDSHVSASLDIIAEFCTQLDEDTKLPFEINFKNDPTDSEAQIIDKFLNKWVKENKFDNRLYDIVRNVIKFGDQFFIRDPETYQWLPVYQTNIESIIVNEGRGKNYEFVRVRDLDYNHPALTATHTPIQNQGSYPTMPGNAYTNVDYNNKLITTTGSGGRFTKGQRSTDVLAEHVVHLSMNNGLDPNWPFGTSILEKIYKTFKQKELLEDSVLIYRTQRAPERRLFYIDVGEMPENKAMQFVERMKNEIHQRRIPSKTGGTSNTNMMDASYSPLSILEDFFFPQRCLNLDTKIPLLDGRTLTLNEIINEYQQDKENFVYSINPETKVSEPGKIAWAGITKKNTQVLRIQLDNGKEVTATPDHKFILECGDQKQAQNLKLGQSLLSLSGNIVKILDIQVLEETIDTGDITVESYSNSHLFALEADIYVHNSDGRGSKVETLPGGDTSWGIDELNYFDNKLARGLRVPSSYLPTGPEDSQLTFNDGRTGVALFQELRFAKYCERIQNTISPAFDKDFKLYLKGNDVSISASVFDLKFVPPQNFGTWRKIEVDQAHINNFVSVSSIPYLSKRKLMEKYLGWTPAEITENLKMFSEENPDKFRNSKLSKIMGNDPRSNVGLNNVGITQSSLNVPEPEEGDFENSPEESGQEEAPPNIGGEGNEPASTPPPAPPTT